MINDTFCCSTSKQTLLNVNKKTNDDQYYNKHNILKQNQDEKNEFLKEYNQYCENFELIDQLGKGAESFVFKCRIKNNNKDFALKTIKINEKQKRNIKEYYILNKLKNHQIIKLYKLYKNEKENIDFLLLEYAKFGNLIDFKEKLIKRDYFSESLLCYFSFQILKGLKFCHLQNIAHLDLKPQNIVIDECLNAKLIDFSIAICYNNIKSKQIQLPLCGTNFYIPPEILNSDKIDINDLNKVDLYSLGMVLYYLAFGSFPFGLNHDDNKQYKKIYKKVMNGLTFGKEKEYYSYSFIDFLKKLLEPNIKNRINIDEALNHYWIKGAQILFDEKEKLFNACSFLSELITDHIKNFNDYLKQNNSDYCF